MIKFRHRGNFSKMEKLLENAQKINARLILERYGQKGVDALSSATPLDTGLTSTSWEYDIIQTSRGYKLVWSNTNSVDGVVIAILLQYGHGTGTGGYVEGTDYINPAIRPIFDSIVSDLEKEVSRL